MAARIVPKISGPTTDQRLPSAGIHGTTEARSRVGQRRHGLDDQEDRDRCEDGEDEDPGPDRQVPEPAVEATVGGLGAASAVGVLPARPAGSSLSWARPTDLSCRGVVVRRRPATAGRSPDDDWASVELVYYLTVIASIEATTSVRSASEIGAEPAAVAALRLAVGAGGVGRVALDQVDLVLGVVGVAEDQVRHEDRRVGAGLGRGAVDLDDDVTVGARVVPRARRPRSWPRRRPSGRRTPCRPRARPCRGQPTADASA